MSDERFIPFLRSEVTAACIDACDPADHAAVREIHALLAGNVHQRYRPRLRAIENDFFLLHPPEYTRGEQAAPAADRERARHRLEAALTALALTAGYTRVGEDELAHAFRSHALLRVRMEVDREAMAGALLFRRGQTVETGEVPTWFGLRKKAVDYVRYSRMLVYVTFHDGHGAAQSESGRDEARRSDTPGATVVKLFENVPRDDMEMLFPGVQPRMRLIDKLMIAVPALISGIVLVSTKLISAVGLVILLLAFWLGLRDAPVELNQAAVVTVGAGTVALGGYLMRQYTKFTRRRIQFMKVIAENLYFRNMDNDAGVFYRLLGASEDAEFIQAVLGYHMLRTADGPLTEAALAARVEAWPALGRGREFRYAADEAVATLQELGLVTASGDGAWSAVTLSAASDRLRRSWCDAAG